METFFPQLWAIAWARPPLEVSPLDFLRKDKNPIGVALALFFFNEKKKMTSPPPPLIHVLIASNAAHFFFLPFCFQCGEVVIVLEYVFGSALCS